MRSKIYGMDIQTIIKACYSKLLKKKFKGVVFCNVFKKLSRNSRVGDFYIVNTDGVNSGEHWFPVIRGSDFWLICDCTVWTPEWDYNSIASRLKLPVIIDRGEIEGMNSLLCGEFSIMAVIQMSELLQENSWLNYVNYPENFYSKSLLKNVSNKTLNEFVYEYIYNTLSSDLKIKPENRRQVEQWLKSNLPQK